MHRSCTLKSQISTSVARLVTARPFCAVKSRFSSSRKFTSIEEIHAYIDNAPHSSWDPSIYSKPPSGPNGLNKMPDATSEISPDELKSLCSLSALTYPSDPEQRKQLLDSLNSQIHFLNHLHSTQSEKITASVQNLNLSNTIKSNRITFEKLLSSVENIEDNVDIKKGEIASKESQNLSKLAKLHENDFYVSKP